MSKRAEQKALEVFPRSQKYTFSQRLIINDMRDGFIQGYEQAEKDLALTWEDVAILITIYEQGIDNGDYQRYNEAEWMKEYSQDILRRFNEIRKK